MKSLLTLIDITETGSNRNYEPFKSSQQANYNTVVQTLSLRSNILAKPIKFYRKNIDDIGFGSDYTGSQLVWILDFEYDSADIDINTLLSDFEYVPIITGLNESVDINKSMFETSCSRTCNIVFKEIDS